MSFWNKKENAEAILTHVDPIKKNIADLEIRISTLENSSNKREKMAFTEFSSLIEEQQQTILKKISVIEDHQETTSNKITDQQNTTFAEYKKLIEELQHKQNILEERIAVYDEKIQNVKTLSARIEALLAELEAKKSETIKTTPKSFVPVVFTNKQPSWIKKPKEEMKDDTQ